MEEDIAVVVEGAAEEEDIPKDSPAEDAVLVGDSHKVAKMAKEAVEVVDSAVAEVEEADAVAVAAKLILKIDHRHHAHTRPKVDANPTKENNALTTMLIHNSNNNNNNNGNNHKLAKPLLV